MAGGRGHVSGEDGNMKFRHGSLILLHGVRYTSAKLSSDTESSQQCEREGSPQVSPPLREGHRIREGRRNACRRNFVCKLLCKSCTPPLPLIASNRDFVTA